MPEYNLSPVYSNDTYSHFQIQQLLLAEGLRQDKNLDYTCALYDSNNHIVATGSCFKNTLRCIAVEHQKQGEGLLGQIITHLTSIQFQRGNTHFFLYTKAASAEAFKHLSFHEIARVSEQIVFMENRKNGFENYCTNLCQNFQKSGPAAAIIMNANPFTCGHLYLIEKAAAENALIHLFLISEDISLIPFEIRKALVLDGISHLKNICVHETGPYLISNATFPSYFQKNEPDVIKSHALLDTIIFTRIARALNIQRRYLGDEPASLVTKMYNQTLQKNLPENNIECIVVPRKKYNNLPISASSVRQLIKKGDFDSLQHLLPEASLNYFRSDCARSVIHKIQQSESVIHY